MPDITMKRERTDRWTKMRLSRARSSGTAASCHMLSSVDCIIPTSESEFSVHTGRPYPVDLCETPFNERFDQLYAAQQALAWAADPEQRESPLDMINRCTVWHWGRFRRLSF